MTTLSSRKFKQGPLTFTVKHVHDEDATPDHIEGPDANTYADCTPKERAQYLAADAVRLAQWKNDEWHYLGIVVEIQIQTAQNWAVPPTVARASLWGIESDSDESYFKEVERDLIEEAKGDFKTTRAAMRRVKLDALPDAEEVR